MLKIHSCCGITFFAVSGLYINQVNESTLHNYGSFFSDLYHAQCHVGSNFYDALEIPENKFHLVSVYLVLLHLLTWIILFTSAEKNLQTFV